VAKDVTLLIKLNDQASGKIGKITNSTKRLEKAANGATNSIRRTNRGIANTGRASEKAAKGVNKLGKAIRGLVLGFGAFQAGKFVIFKTAELQKQTKSLEVLTGSLGNARTIIKELQQFGAVTPFSSSELIEAAKRLKAFGVETEDVVDVTKRLADVAGATGADLGGITTAFGQIQAKGRLQGEELLQLQERGVNLQEQLRQQYGLTADEFQKALEQGRFGADAVRFALVELTEEGGKYAGGAIAQSETLAGKFSTLIDNVERLATKIGQKLQPILDFVLDTSIAIVDAINKALAGPDYATATARLTTVTEQIEKAKTNIKNLEAAGVTLTSPGLPIRGIDGEVLPQTTVSPLATEQGLLAKLQGERKFLEGRIKELEKSFLKVEEPTKRKPGEPPTLRDPRGGGGTGGGTKADPLASLKNQIETLKEGVLLAKTRTKEEERQQTLLNSIAALTRIRTDDNAELVDEAIKLTGELFYQEGLQRQAADADKKRQEAAKKLNELYKGIGDTIASSIVQSLQEAVKGTAKLADIATSMLNRLIDQFIQLALVQASGIGGPIGAIAGFLSGGRANGGTVMGGRSYVVGERGPELFTPGRTGSIAPNSALGGDTSVVVNVDASGTEVQGNQGNADQLGRLIGQAVQAELIKQKRPGGLLTR
jgi:tape measure domain-containing protein